MASCLEIDFGHCIIRRTGVGGMHLGGRYSVQPFPLAGVAFRRQKIFGKGAGGHAEVANLASRLIRMSKKCCGHLACEWAVPCL